MWALGAGGSRSSLRARNECPNVQIQAVACNFEAPRHEGRRQGLCKKPGPERIGSGDTLRFDLGVMRYIRLGGDRLSASRR